MRAVRDHLIISAIPEAKWIARKLARRYSRIDEDDLVSAGMIGLMKAEARFDDRRGLQFVSFAKFYMRGEMLDFVRREGPVPHDELAQRRRDPARAAAGVRFHTKRVFKYDDVVRRSTRDVGQLEERIKEHDRELLLQGMTARLEWLARIRLDGTLATEVGRELGVTATRVVQLQRQAEKEIRALMEEEGLVPADLI